MSCFTTLFALSLLVTLVVAVDSDTLSKLYVTLTAIAFGIMCVHVVGRDLGRNKSYILSAIALGVMLVGLIVVVVAGGEAAMTKALLVLYGGPVLLSLMHFMMLGAKYADKTARGRK